MIAGLYPYARGGVVHPPSVTLREIPHSLAVNPRYRDDLLVLAGDRACAEHLERFGLEVHRRFDDAPGWVHRDAAHLMKHWMCLWALRTHGGFLWLDWDTVCLEDPKQALLPLVATSATPRFVRIPHYWAVVNCGVYSAPARWADALERSFESPVSEPNDELLWASILPADTPDRPEYWWGDRVVHVEREEEIGLVGRETVVVHVKKLEWAARLRARHQRVGAVC